MGLSDVDKLEGYTARPASAGQGGKGSMAGMKPKFAGMGSMTRKATTGIADSAKKPKMGKGAMAGGIKSVTSSKGC